MFDVIPRDDRARMQWSALADPAMIDDPGVAHALALVLRALDLGWVGLADLEALVHASHSPTWGGSGFEELRMEPDWADAGGSRVRVGLADDEVICARSPFFSAVRWLCHEWRVSQEPGYTLTDVATGVGLDLPRGVAVILGRAPPADLVVPDPVVARRHLRFAWEDGRCVVSVLEAAGDAYLNGRRVIGEVPLQFGDELDLGGGIRLRVGATSRPRLGPR